MAKSYWLVKSEPSAFSIDDLKACPKGISTWDGVRNYQARNIMRDECRKGDGVLFYHSRIKAPAVVGVAAVVRESYPDHTQFAKESPYYDPKASQEKPRWFMVDVQYKRHLASPVTLNQIKSSPELSDMVLVTRGRLSVQPVTREEWDCILKMGLA